MGRAIAKDNYDLTYEKFEENLKKHKFLLYENYLQSVPLRELNNGRWLYLKHDGIINFSDNYTKNTYKVEEINIYISECISNYSLDYKLSSGELFCLEKSKKEFKDNKDKKSLEVFGMVFDEEFLEDFKNAKLIKTGNNFFYLDDDKRVKLNKSIEEKIYIGKKLDYIINDYKISVISKEKENKLSTIIKSRIKKLDEDLELKNKLDREQIKKQVFDIDSNKILEVKSIEKKQDKLEFKDKFTGFYVLGDYIKGASFSGILSVKQISENKVYFEIIGYMGKPSYNAGRARGEIELINGIGSFTVENDEINKCSISFNFIDNKVIVTETNYGFSCGFGNNVSVDGEYKKLKDVFYTLSYP